MTRPPQSTDSPSPDSAHLRIPWPALSIGLAIVALVSLGTLVVIVSVKNVDILSTVALALAILSFAAQLIVSMLQTESSAKLNGSTESALAEMRATTESLLTNQRDQFDLVLGAALKAIPAAVDDVVGSSENSDDANGDGDATSGGESQQSEFEQSLSKHMREYLERPLLQPTRGPRNARTTLPSDLELYPTKEAGKVGLAKLRNLAPEFVPALVSMATKIRAAEKAGRPPVAFYKISKSSEPGPTHQALVDAGLVERNIVEGDSGSSRVQYSLTEDGRTIARLFLPQQPKPKWLIDALSGDDE